MYNFYKTNLTLKDILVTFKFVIINNTVKNTQRAKSAYIPMYLVSA